MIHYHGTPITPDVAALEALNGGHAFVSFAAPQNLGLALDVCQSYAVDNGAFSAWKAGNPVADWKDYYSWVDGLRLSPSFDFSVIPDVIDGSEEDNDRLLIAWPWRAMPWVGSPVWHLHESIGRLVGLASAWPRVCLGSSGAFSQIGTPAWWQRMGAAFNAICDSDGRPACKVHGLRMLDPRVFGKFPFASADSTNIARNIGIDSAWRGTYQPATKGARALVMRGRIEATQSPQRWDKSYVQESLWSLQ